VATAPRRSPSTATTRCPARRRRTGLCGLGSYTVYFDIHFSRPFAAHGTWQGSTVTPGSASATGRGSGAYLTFDTSNSTMVRAKVGMSYVSVAGTRNNMAQEMPGWNPTAVAAKTRADWRQALNTVQVGGGSDADLTTFYTALYHSLQFPSVYSDVDGRYMGFDNQIHRVPAGQTQYSTFSDWDTYRALAPLQTMLFPKQAGDMANSLIRDAHEQGDWMPKWPVANVSTTGTMNGDNAVPLIANTVAFGGRNVNIADVLPVMEKGANHSQVLGWGWQERQCVEEYVQTRLRTQRRLLAGRTRSARRLRDAGVVDRRLRHLANGRRDRRQDDRGPVPAAWPELAEHLQPHDRLPPAAR
jgi:putative alpha-1,2-mannosidase